MKRFPPREAILDQLAYVLDEIEALKPLIRRVPAIVLESRPMSDTYAINEIFAWMGLADKYLWLPRMQAVVKGEVITGLEEEVKARLQEEGWRIRPIGAILEMQAAHRRALLDYLRSLTPEEWEREVAGPAEEKVSVQELAYLLTQEDVRYLRAVGERLHESHVSLR